MPNVVQQKQTAALKTTPRAQQSVPVKQAEKDAAPAPVDPLVTILNRNAFYKDGYRFLVYIAMGEAAAIVLLVITLLALVAAYKPQNNYFATTADGRLIPMIALDQPNIDRAKLVSWANQAETEIMTFGFHDFRQRLTAAGAKYFTDEGWASFTKALERARIIEAVEGSQQVITAAPQGAAVITEEGIENGTYFWIVQLPLAITFMAGNRNSTNQTLLTLKIVRVPTLKNPEGIGIQQWLAGQR